MVWIDNVRCCKPLSDQPSEAGSLMKTRRWIVLGSTGQLGAALRKLLEIERPFDEVFCPSRAELELSNSGSVEQYLFEVRPNVVVNCAAWTDVDGAEVNQVACHSINGQLPLLLARCMSRHRIGLLVQISTDYVFDGRLRRPYSEVDQPNPLSVYGWSKLQGEAVTQVAPQNAIVVRTSGLYSRTRPNFVTTILRKSREGAAFNVVDDLVGHPTYANDASQRVLELASMFLAGQISSGSIFHAVNSGVASRFDLAKEVVQLSGGDPRHITPVSSYGRNIGAERPSRVELGDERASSIGLAPMRPWKEALREFIHR